MVYIRHHVDTWWHHGWSQYFSRKESLLPLALQSMLDRSGNASWAAFNASLLFPPVTRKVFIWAEYSLFNIVISSFIFASHRSTLLPTTPAQTKKISCPPAWFSSLQEELAFCSQYCCFHRPGHMRFYPFTGKWVNRSLGNKNHHPHPHKKKPWGSISGNYMHIASSVWCKMPCQLHGIFSPLKPGPRKNRKKHPETWSLPGSLGRFFWGAKNWGFWNASKSELICSCWRSWGWSPPVT